MTREEAKSFWQIRYENAKDFDDSNWEAQEREEHREYVEALRMAIEALSADCTGHWIKHGEPPWYVIECSECGAKWQMSGSWDANNFCGNCGADMRGE